MKGKVNIMNMSDLIWPRKYFNAIWNPPSKENKIINRILTVGLIVLIPLNIFLVFFGFF